MPQTHRATTVRDRAAGRRPVHPEPAADADPQHHRGQLARPVLRLL